MPKTINERISYFRKLSNLTQTETAELLNMKYSTYSQMERKGTISAEMVVRLANIFGIPTEYLLYDHDASFPHNGEIVMTARQNTVLPNDDQIILTHKETNIMKIYRNMSKENREEFERMIEKIYKSEKS